MWQVLCRFFISTAVTIFVIPTASDGRFVGPEWRNLFSSAASV
jgi:hypothetical protein